MIKDERLERVLAAEVDWAETVSRVGEMSEALFSALGDVLTDPPREDELQAELAKLDDFVRSTLSRVNELSQKLLNSIGDDAAACERGSSDRASEAATDPSNAEQHKQDPL